MYVVITLITEDDLHLETLLQCKIDHIAHSDIDSKIANLCDSWMELFMRDRPGFIDKHNRDWIQLTITRGDGNQSSSLIPVLMYGGEAYLHELDDLRDPKRHLRK